MTKDEKIQEAMRIVLRIESNVLTFSDQTDVKVMEVYYNKIVELRKQLKNFLGAIVN